VTVRCEGGPLDGERVADVGRYFTEPARVVAWAAVPGWSSGYYERAGDRYVWRVG
jgi:hypothetical protein